MTKAAIRTPEAIASRLEEVREQVRLMIVQSGELRPGDRVNEQALSNQLGVGRNTCREALRSLGHARLLRIVPNRGAEVRRLSLEEALDLYDIRAGLARTSGRLIALRLTTEEERALEALSVEMQEAVSGRDTEKYRVLNIEFHRQLMLVTKNPRLIEVNQALQDELKLYIPKGVFSLAQMQASNREHRELFEAVRSGDAESAAQAFEVHVLTGKQRMLDTVAIYGREA
jgi:DNA-binding GntR family transcriptional regulator